MISMMSSITMMKPALSDIANGFPKISSGHVSIFAQSGIQAAPSDGGASTAGSLSVWSNEDIILVISFTLIILVLLAIAIISIITLNRRVNRCQFCSTQMHLSGYETTRISHCAKLITAIYICPKCGNIKTKTNKVFASSE